MREDSDIASQPLTLCVHLLLPSVSIALLCSFLLGLGDSCFNTQLYSILGRVYADQSTAAFAIFKFIQVSFPARRPSEMCARFLVVFFFRRAASQTLSHETRRSLSLPVCLRRRRLLLLRPPDAVVAAPADGRAGLRWNALLLCGGEDGELFYRFAGTVDCSLFFFFFFLNQDR